MTRHAGRPAGQSLLKRESNFNRLLEEKYVMRPFEFLACSGIVAALAVATSIAEPVGATAPDDPCVTVLKGDVEGALGMPVTKTKRSDQSISGAQSMSCSFRTAHFLPSASVTAIRFDSVKDATSTFRDMIAQNAKLESETPVTLHGIGDDAAVVSSIVYTRKGSVIYSFGILPMPGSVAKSEQLAKATLPRIKP